MGGLFSGIASSVGNALGLGSNLSSALATSGTSATQAGLTSSLENLANQEIGYGSEVTPTGISEYTAGATGQLTPAQAAMSANQLTAANQGTQGAYSNLGIGSSTMVGQDEAANQLQNLAEQANLEAQSQQLGLAGMGAGLNFLQAGGQSLTGAANVTQQEVSDLLAALSGGSTSPTTSPTGTTAGTGLGVGSTGAVTPNYDILSGATGSSDVAGQQALAGAGLF
jgi:hypothetical protein